MAQIGYPDWQRIETWDGGSLFKETNVSHNAQVTFGPFNCVNWQSVCWVASLSVGQAQVRLLWADGPNPLTSFEMGEVSYLLDAGFGAEVNTIVPNRGPWVQIDFIPIGGAATWASTLFLSQRVDLGNTSWVQPYLFSGIAHTTAAGATTTLGIFSVVSKPAYFFFNNGASACSDRLLAMQTDGSYAQIYSNPTAANGNDHGTITLPPASCKVQVQNTGAASSTWQFPVIADALGAS